MGVFDLPRRVMAENPNQEWVGPLTTADGWSIEPDADNPRLWWAVNQRPGAASVRRPIEFDSKREVLPLCYTFLPATDTAPTRVLIGHESGCSMYNLTLQRATRVRLFTGHSGKVYSIVVAKDKERPWFVTAGADQTVAAWGLTDWPSQPNLGATFAAKAGRVEVTAIDPGSPAWETGLRVGDTIDLLVVDAGRIVYDRRPKE